MTATAAKRETVGGHLIRLLKHDFQVMNFMLELLPKDTSQVHQFLSGNLNELHFYLKGISTLFTQGSTDSKWKFSG